MSCVFDWNVRHDRPATEVTALLGGKAAELNVMAVDLRLPVPPAFTISTEACRAFLASGWPDGLDAEIRAHLTTMERHVDRRFGDAAAPLLVSVRSGAPVSMPGMMDTILNLGLNEATTEGLSTASNSPAFAADCRRRFEEMFTGVVGVADVPSDPWAQLRAAIEAVFRSWNSDRARAYRQREAIPDDLGTAVTVQAMVFGNRSADSGSGVLFTRDPATGAPAQYGDVLFEAQGEDVVAGTHPTATLDELQARMPDVARELARYADLLERHHADMCDVEFTIERGRLWLLQCRIGKRSPQAALRIAIDMAEADDFPLTRQQAVKRVVHLLANPPHAITHPVSDAVPLTTGLPASPGLAAGEIATSADRAIAMADAGRSVILVRAETSPDDVPGMARAAGLLTSRGGLACHAAVVARGWGIPAVVGASAVAVEDERVSIDGRELAAGSRITIDGSTGEVFEGIVTGSSVPSPEAETLVSWARELGIVIGETPPPDATAPRANDEGELDGPATVDPDSVLTALAIKGYATIDDLVEALLAPAESVGPLLACLARDGLVDDATGAYRLTAEGGNVTSRIMAEDGDRWGSERATAALESFADLDNRVKEVVTAWQLREVDGASVVNDHADEAYDAGVLARLSSLHDDAIAWLTRHAAQLPRFGRYRARLERAVRLALGGDTRYLASPRVDSYHSAWFELHEDLILLSGRTRAEEVAAGRA
jgi:pyruvate,orthophosphate dikinase